MNDHYQKIVLIATRRLRSLLLFIVFSCLLQKGMAQCPPNIDFEQGNFSNWECWVGHTYNLGGKNSIQWDVPPENTPVNPALYPNRFQMMSAFPGNGLDFFGQFPVNCPNGSGKSIKLGNTSGGHEAEGVSYTFTIPPGQNTYSLIYNYAVVFQGPVHQDYEQPRMVIEILNLTDYEMIGCSSFNFFYSTSSPTLPGFFLSTTNNTPTPVWCKNWTATSIKLDNLAGKTIRLFFKSADCVFTEHFGYAYIDVNTECSSSFTGATYCPDDAFINVRAPFGYEKYTWWDAGFTTVLGNTQTVNFTPPPPSGSTIAVVLEPFNGFGCRDTLYANLYDTLTLQSLAGPDRTSCNAAAVQLGANVRPGLTYSWSPAAGLNNPAIANPVATTNTTTQYILTTANAGGGCATRDTTIVTAVTLDNSLAVSGPVQFCANASSLTTLTVPAADSVQWYRNGGAIAGATQRTYTVTQTGTYYATVFSFAGCTLNTTNQVITVNAAPLPGFTVNAAVQCFKDNQFQFTNTSTIAAGSLQYNWDFGDGVSSTLAHPAHGYSLPGTYTVKLLATSDMGCKDSVSFVVIVNESPVAGFSINNNEQCFTNNQFVFTNTSTIAAGTMQYEWDFGDGNLSNLTSPTHGYALPGVYTVKLRVTSDKACKDSISFTVNVNSSPAPGFSINAAQQCFTNNQFVFTNTSNIPSGSLSYDWDFGDGNGASSVSPVHQYNLPGNYTVKLRVSSDKGCKDSVSLPVTVDHSPAAGFTINATEQCFKNNSFAFTNTSTITGGTMLYNWNFGDGNVSSSTDPVHTYSLPGTYPVKLVVTSDKGCKDSISFTVQVNASPVVGFTVNTAEQCFTNNSFAFSNTSTLAAGNMQYQWYFGDGNTATTRDVTYHYTAAGTYSVKLVTGSDKGCADSTTFNVIINPAPAPGFTVANPQQCLTNNQFNFINSSSIASGTLQYAWTLGDGASAGTRDISHSYAGAGEYPVKMTVSSDKGCTDSSSSIVKVHDFAVADFAVEPACTNQVLAIDNKTVNNTSATINYTWDFGNGQTSHAQHPVYSYPAPGPYTITLSVNSVQCPLPVTVKQFNMVVDNPTVAARYPDKTAVMNYPEQLHARHIGASVLWTPPLSLDNPTSYDPVFKGMASQLYLIQLRSTHGCLTVDTQYVKTRKHVEIFVPGSFTPDGNGLNDYLYPTLMGFTSVNYFRVYNRWGKLLYQVKGDRPGWDGKINGKVQDTQTVVWMIEAIDMDGMVHQQQGTSVLLR